MAAWNRAERYREHAVRKIEIDEGLRLRFPGRDAEFHDGVEIGTVAALMAVVGGDFRRVVAADNVEQVRALAEKLGYHLTIPSREGESREVSFSTATPRPKLSLGPSGPECVARPETAAARQTSARRSAPILVHSA